MRSFWILAAFITFCLTTPSFGATVGKVGAGGTVLFVKFSQQESEKYTAGLTIKISYDAGESTGMILSKKGNRGRIRLDEPTDGIVAGTELTIVPADGSLVSENTETAAPAKPGAFPANAALAISKTPASPYVIYANTGGKSNSDGSSGDMFDTFSFVSANTKLQYMILFGQIQVGPELAYFSTTNKLANTSTVGDEDSETVDVQIKYSLLEAGFMSRYMFTPYIAQKIIPSAGLGFGIGQYSRTIGEKDPQKASTQILKVQFGIQYMLTSSIGFDAAFEYRSDSVRFQETEVTTTGSDTVEKTEDVSQKISSTGIVYGLWLYF